MCPRILLFKNFLFGNQQKFEVWQKNEINTSSLNGKICNYCLTNEGWHNNQFTKLLSFKVASCITSGLIGRCQRLLTCKTISTYSYIPAN